MTDLFEILTQAPPEKTPPAPAPKVELPGDEAIGNTPDLAAQVAALTARIDQRDAKEKADHDKKEIAGKRAGRRTILDTALAAVRGERDAADRKRRAGRNLFRKSGKR